MRRYFYFLLCLILFSCSKNGSNITNSNYAIPKGTVVKFEILCDNSDLVGVDYLDVQGNSISTNVNNGWTYIYTTTQKMSSISLGALSLTSPQKSVTARIYINGTLKKEAIGIAVNANYP